LAECTKKGAVKFAWLLPNEKLTDGFLIPGIPHGAFVYLFEDFEKGGIETTQIQDNSQLTQPKTKDNLAFMNRYFPVGQMQTAVMQS